MPNQLTKNTTQTLIYVIFFVLGVFGYIGLFLFDIFLESGGFKLVFPSFKWPKEIEAFLIYVGINGDFVRPSLVAGMTISIFSILFSYICVHYFIGVLASLQTPLRNFAMGRKSLIDLIDNLFPIFKLILFALILFFGHFLIFKNWGAPLASLQLAYRFWTEEFGGTFGDMRMPDLNVVLLKHKGEFNSFFIENFPWALFLFHYMAGMAIELYFLHSVINVDNMVNGVVNAVNERIRRRKSNEVQGQDAPEVTQETVQSPYEAYAGNVPLMTEQPEEMARASEGKLNPEDERLRVIGGNEKISPREARAFPELYRVEESRDNGRMVYRIYTREFYESMEGSI